MAGETSRLIQVTDGTHCRILLSGDTRQPAIAVVRACEGAIKRSSEQNGNFRNPSGTGRPSSTSPPRRMPTAEISAGNRLRRGADIE